MVNTEQHNERTALVQKPLTANPGSFALSMLKAIISIKSAIPKQTMMRSQLSVAAATASRSRQTPTMMASIIQMRNIAKMSVPRLSIWT